MKRLFFTIILCAISLSLSAQWFGDGLTAGTAYYGVINSTSPMQAWNTANFPGGVVYVGRSTTGQNDLEIASGGILNISQGITVKFCTTSSDLRITGTGILNASGSSSSLIDFTKNQQATWGHISFEGSTGNSVMNYCIIENGYKNGSGIEGYGGGIHANTNNLAISNCIIRNNYAIWGGGVFVNQNMSPSISSCYVFNNRSGEGGGGFYFWNGSRSVITNCIFDSNHCLEPGVPYYTGGGLGAQSLTAIKVLNCTFVNNTSTQLSGQSIMLYRSSGDIVSNCIVWGSGVNQFYLSGSNTVQYTAVVLNAPLGTGNITLSSNNTDPMGPNFTNPAAADYTLTYLSPCRNSGTAIGAPTTDYLGKSRVLPYDMGAYEYLTCLWKVAATSSDWNSASNWDGGVPTSTSDIIIPTGASYYPVASPGPDFTIGSTASLLLSPGAKATFNSLINNGTLHLETNSANGSASLITGSYSGNDAIVDLFLAGGAGTYGPKWHYISSPFTSLSISPFTSVTKNLSQWVENMASANLLIGWVAYDGYVYRVDGNPPYSGPTFSSFTQGKGYNHYFTSDHTYSLQGQLNTNDVTCDLNYTVTDPLQPVRYGLNLLGNPFSSGLDWDAIVGNKSFPGNTSRAIYFNRNGAIVYYVNGIGSDPSVTGIIPPMQGFFTKTYSEGNSIILSAQARSNGAIAARYKSLQINSYVRLKLSSGNYDDYTVVRFDHDAKSGLDLDFDAPKLFLDNTKPFIYSVSEGQIFAINGLPFPDSVVNVPLVINVPTTGQLKISASEIENLEYYNVRLIDKLTSTEYNLKINPQITLPLQSGLITNRFFLKVSVLMTAVEDPQVKQGVFNIYHSFGNIVIEPLNNEWDGKSATVRVIDINGKEYYIFDNNIFRVNSKISLPVNLKKGIYLVEVKSAFKIFTGKVFINQ